jgi:hypothetical protein
MAGQPRSDLVASAALTGFYFLSYVMPAPGMSVSDHDFITALVVTLPPGVKPARSTRPSTPN